MSKPREAVGCHRTLHVLSQNAVSQKLAEKLPTVGAEVRMGNRGPSGPTPRHIPPWRTWPTPLRASSLLGVKCRADTALQNRNAPEDPVPRGFCRIREWWDPALGNV